MPASARDSTWGPILYYAAARGRTRACYDAANLVLACHLINSPLLPPATGGRTALPLALRQREAVWYELLRPSFPPSTSLAMVEVAMYLAVGG